MEIYHYFSGTIQIVAYGSLFLHIADRYHRIWQYRIGSAESRRMAGVTRSKVEGNTNNPLIPTIRFSRCFKPDCKIFEDRQVLNSVQYQTQYQTMITILVWNVMIQLVNLGLSALQLKPSGPDYDHCLSANRLERASESDREKIEVASSIALLYGSFEAPACTCPQILVYKRPHKKYARYRNGFP